MSGALADLRHEVGPGTIVNIPKEQAVRAFIFSIRTVQWRGGLGGFQVKVLPKAAEVTS